MTSLWKQYIPRYAQILKKSTETSLVEWIIAFGGSKSIFQGWSLKRQLRNSWNTTDFRYLFLFFASFPNSLGLATLILNFRLLQSLTYLSHTLFYPRITFNSIPSLFLRSSSFTPTPSNHSYWSLFTDLLSHTVSIDFLKHLSTTAIKLTRVRFYFLFYFTFGMR